MEATTLQPKKVVRIIPPTVSTTETIKTAHRQIRVVAYCRVSTKQEEQLNSYDVQKRYVESAKKYVDISQKSVIIKV